MLSIILWSVIQVALNYQYLISFYCWVVFDGINVTEFNLSVEKYLGCF